MKKYTSYIMTLFVLMFVGIINVKAATMTPSSASIKVGKSVTLTINVLDGITYSLDFDNSYFDVNNTTCGNRSSITSNCTIQLTAKSSLSLTENKTITITLTPSSNDSVVTSSITINANKEAPSTSAQTTTAAANSTKSNNANIKSIIMKTNDNTEVSLTPKFDVNTYEYQAEVNSTVKTVSFNVVLEDSKATYVISSNVNEELKAGDTTKIVITVTAEDGTKKAYNISVKREALTTDATLKSLTIKEVKGFKLKENKYNYVIKLDKSIKKLNIECEPNDENATCTIDGDDSIKDGSKVKITVVAPDESKRVYTLTVKYNEEEKEVEEVKAEKNPLIIMGLSIMAFGLIGGIIYVIKK